MPKGTNSEQCPDKTLSFVKIYNIQHLFHCVRKPNQHCNKRTATKDSICSALMIKIRLVYQGIMTMEL